MAAKQHGVANAHQARPARKARHRNSRKNGSRHCRGRDREISSVREGASLCSHLARLHTHIGAISAILLEEIPGRDHETGFVELRGFHERAQLSEPTIANRIEEVVTLLRDPDETRGKSNGIRDVTLRVKYAQKKVRIYKPHETKALFATADQEEEETFKFFLGTGARDREVQQARWVDIDFEGKVFHIIDDGDTKTKDREERLVPMADDLVKMLRARHKRFPKNRLVFPNKQGGPQRHFLRMLKELALRAGLNCSACLNEKRQSCKDTACCGGWILHRFRQTFATSRHRDGASLLDLKKWVGHSDLKTTELYLAESDLESPEVRSCTNNTYAAYV